MIRLRNPNPLFKNGRSYPPIDVVIPVAEKDLQTLPFTLSSLLNHCLNPIRQIHLVTPQIRHLHQYSSDPRIRVYDDKTFLGLSNMDFPENLNSRKGWFTQQVIKLHSVTHCTSQYILWLDSDTVLNQDRVFVNNRRILELLSDELHEPYFRGLNRVFGFPLPKLRFSRIAHHNVACVDCFRKFTAANQIYSATDWLRLMNSCVQPPMYNFADYELCGYIHGIFRHPRIRVYWWNESRSCKDFCSEWLREPHDNSTRLFRPAKPFSISFHSWNRQHNQGDIL